MNSTSQRIQRKRSKGWKMPSNTVSVTRPGKWGNPWKVVQSAPYWIVQDENGKIVKSCFSKEQATAECLQLFRIRMKGLELKIKAELGGKNLACFCKLADPCHADVLLEIANR